MKRNASELELELELENFLRAVEVDDTNKEFRAQRPKICGKMNGFFGVEGDAYATHLSSGFGNQEKLNTFPGCGDGGLPESFVWSQNPVSDHSVISATIDTQASMCGPASSGITFACTATGSAGSPSSAHKPKSGDNQGRGTTSTGSSREQSDDDDIEIDGGSCGQSMDPLSVKKIRRMVSNRESARRSRRRKQAHLVDLETQVDQLRVENGSLYNQFAAADRHLNEAATDNRVLKSDVEALRMKVKLAEDMVAKGSLTCSLKHLLQNYSSPSQPISTHGLFQASDISPSLGIQGDDEASYMSVSDSAHVALELEYADPGNASINHRLNRNVPLIQKNTSLDHLQNLQNRISEAVSCLSENCLSETWP